jgi:hypothetical protein
VRREEQAPFDLTRRVILGVAASPVGAPLVQRAAGSSNLHPFDTWLAERDHLDAMLDVTPEENEKARDQIFDRYAAIERLILRTRCLDLPAIKAKVGIILWLMEMEDADGLPAMRHIKAYIDRTG